MGCVHSRVEKEETVWRCRERKRLMKHLLSCRSELAAAHMAYLQSLRNTGATLRQFTEEESDVLENPLPRVASALSPLSPPPPPPPPPLPPSPPPPRFNSPKKAMAVGGNRNYDDDDSSIGVYTEDDDGESIHCSSWNFWDPLGIPLVSNCYSPVMPMKDVEDEENWAETITEFGDEDDEGVENAGKTEFEGRGIDLPSGLLKEKLDSRELNDDESLTVSQITNEADAVSAAWRSEKTLLGIVKHIDDYFLKAAAGGSDLLVLLESTHGQRPEGNFMGAKGRTSKTAKVLSWSWSLKSPHSNKGVCGKNCESCSPGKHRITLEKIYADEVNLYKEVKEDELAKFQLKKMISLLEKLETSENDHARSEKLRLDIETLQAQILSLQDSINATCLSISKSRDEELHPQFLELLSGLSSMWRTMNECHRIQNHISQQGNLLDKHPSTEPTSESHRFATLQLENEVAFWHSSFCSLFSSLREYSHVLNQWVRLTDCLPYSTNISSSIKRIHSICDEWQMALDRIPDKVAADSIKNLVSVIHSIVLQQNAELSLQKKLKRLENRLDRELNSISAPQFTSPDHQPTSNNTKIDSLKKRVEEEKAKYLTSISVSRAMTPNNLHTCLPNVFHALVRFSNVYVQALDNIVTPSEASTGC